MSSGGTSCISIGVMSSSLSGEGHLVDEPGGELGPSKRLSTVLPVAELDLEPGGASTGVARREETQLGAGRGYKRRRAAGAR